MGKKRIKMQQDEIDTVLSQCKRGTLSTASADGVPYGIPLNYFYIKNECALYFHCAKKGRKLDNIIKNNQVSFSVVDYELINEEHYVTNYRSVIVEGIAEIITESDEKRRLLSLLCDSLLPTATRNKNEVIEKELNYVNIVKISIVKFSGKINADDM